MRAIPARARMLAGHVLRLAVVVAIVLLVHAAHARRLARRQTADLADVSLARVQAHVPETVAIGGDAAAVAGGRDLVDAAGERVGTILRTSPAGDAAIGFSGPTDLLVVCDRDLVVAGVEILSSGDTRDHVLAIERDPGFLASLAGRSLDELAAGEASRADAVAGSTLTSLAIREALALRLGGSAATSRFDVEPSLDDLRRVFPAATAIAPDAGEPAVIRVTDADGTPLGWALRTSPAADRVIGYQGPTDAVVAFDTAGRVAGVLVTASYDNEPYVGYVRDDRAFRRLWRGMSLEEIAGIDPAATGVEGVSGATMTSQAVAEGIVRAARAHAAESPPVAAGWTATARTVLDSVEGPQWGAIAVILTGIVTAFTRLRGTWFGRLVLPLIVLAYLGFGAGALVSQAQVWGWAQSGVPRGAVVLAVLLVVSVLLPATTRRNVYCSHLCAHGAAQQLLSRVVKPRWSVPTRLRPLATILPWILLVLAILAAILDLPLALVDLEPFDAYLPTVAGIAALAIFAVSLAASLAVPMAYCRHGCPTGALLDHIRLNRRSGSITWRDGLLLACLVVAGATWWWGA